MTTVVEPLSVQGLVKSYGDVHAVRGIDLAVRQGEVFGFVGPAPPTDCPGSGSGQHSL